MNHSRATQLYPTGILTNPAPGPFAFETTEIKLRARLREWKVRRTKACDRVSPEHAAQELRDGTLQVSHRNATVDTQSFNLEEHRIVSRVGVSRLKTRPGAIILTGTPRRCMA